MKWNIMTLTFNYITGRHGVTQDTREMQNNSLSLVLLRSALSSLSAGDDHVGSSGCKNLSLFTQPPATGQRGPEKELEKLD